MLARETKRRERTRDKYIQFDRIQLSLLGHDLFDIRFETRVCVE